MLGYEGLRSGNDRGCPWSDVVASEMDFVERGSGGGGGGTGHVACGSLEEDYWRRVLGRVRSKDETEPANQSGFLLTPEVWGPCTHACMGHLALFIR